MSWGGQPIPLVLFVGGSGRSGSTLLERLLGELPGVLPLGEVVHLWSRGLLDDQSCACGEPFSRCPFWTRVGDEAFGGWRKVDPHAVLRLQSRVDRHRHLIRSMRRNPSPAYRDRLRAYTTYYHRIYAAAQRITGAQVVVDSSKHASTALALSHDERLDLRTIQIVRDPRGVAYSWAKSVKRPETSGQDLMPQYSAMMSTVLWMSHNVTLDALRYRGRPLVRMRYEDLVRDPRSVVSDAWSALRLPGSGHLPIDDDNTIELGASHSVAGNPMRFKTGRIQLHNDSRWQHEIQRGDRILVNAVAYPLLVRFGYARGFR